MAKKKKHKNVYMGKDSTAKIPKVGKVDAKWEILANTYATIYDALNNKMLTRIEGKFRRTTVKLIRGRFFVLKMLAKKHQPKLVGTIDKLEDLTIAYRKGKISKRELLQKVRKILKSRGLSPRTMRLIEQKIRAAERKG